MSTTQRSTTSHFPTQQHMHDNVKLLKGGIKIAYFVFRHSNHRETRICYLFFVSKKLIFKKIYCQNDAVIEKRPYNIYGTIY